MRQAVKCSAKAPARAFCCLAVLSAFVLSRSDALAQLLLGRTGTDQTDEPAPLDPTIPTGSSARAGLRPPALPEPPLCSFRAPLCVHRAVAVPETLMVTWLSEMEAAHYRLTRVLGLPPPLPDGDRGGGPSLDVYLNTGEPGVRTEVDTWELGVNRDAASAFCVAGTRDSAIARAATLCVAEAIALRLDASETPFSRRAVAAELWLAVGKPTDEDARAMDDFQSHPELATVGRERSRWSEGSALWLEFLNSARGGRDPASVPLAAFALSGGAKSAPDLRVKNEPDTLDVLRSNFGATPSDFARLLGDFAVRRAFVGSRDTQGYFPELRWMSDAGRVRFEWSIPFSSLPRTLAPSRPVEPTGSTYLWVSLDGAPTRASLAFVADWEPPVAFKWNLTVVGADGTPVHQIDVPFLERGTHVERTLADLDGGAGVLISGTNLGGIGPTYPFDPDFEPFEPHSYAVYLSKQ